MLFWWRFNCILYFIISHKFPQWWHNLNFESQYTAFSWICFVNETAVSDIYVSWWTKQLTTWTSTIVLKFYTVYVSVWKRIALHTGHSAFSRIRDSQNNLFCLKFICIMPLSQHNNIYIYQSNQTMADMSNMLQHSIVCVFLLLNWAAACSFSERLKPHSMTWRLNTMAFYIFNLEFHDRGSNFQVNFVLKP